VEESEREGERGREREREGERELICKKMQLFNGEMVTLVPT
jgi:hypothetical protein